MKEELQQEELQLYMKEILDVNALELQLSDDDLLIPYIMNDAVEYYFRLTGVNMNGEWLDDDEAVEVNFQERFTQQSSAQPASAQPASVQPVSVQQASVQPVSVQQTSTKQVSSQIMDSKTVNRQGMLIHQASGNVISIWYDKAYFYQQSYQYHRIGHSWRKEAGQEHIRRLVNLLCVLHDKVTYLEEDACNDMELEIYPLIEFAPLAYWTPINDSISDWYPESQEGIERMLKLAEEAGDQIYLQKVIEYQEITDRIWELENSGKAKTFRNIEKRGDRGKAKELKNLQKRRIILQEELTYDLLKPQHQGIYWLLEKKIQAASSYWPRRQYLNTAQVEEMEVLRNKAYEMALAEGYEGEYPLFSKETYSKQYDGEANSDSKTDSDGKALFQNHTREYLYFAEEHPFTTLEWDDYQFRIIEMRF